jgi:hypothetical protein
VPDVKDKDDKARDKDKETTRQPDSDNEDDSGLLASGPYDADDAEADKVYADVDRKMAERRTARRYVPSRAHTHIHRYTCVCVRRCTLTGVRVRGAR